jgi:hypothetical protein
MMSNRPRLINLTIHNLTREEADAVQKYALELSRETDRKLLTEIGESCNNVLNLIEQKIKLDIKRFEKGRS